MIRTFTTFFNHKKGLIILLIIAFAFRICYSLIGTNYDFQSYLIVGKIAAHGLNVFELTTRYNYSPVWFLILSLFFKLSQFFGLHAELIYRTCIISLLTLFDVGMAYVLVKKYNIKNGWLYLLSPVALYATGFHNQFDNGALLFGLLAVYKLQKFEGAKKRQFFYSALFFFSISLLMKHILILFCLWILLRNKMSLKDRLIFVGTSGAIFIASFLPYASGAGIKGILTNVVFYSSSNNHYLLFEKLGLGFILDSLKQMGIASRTLFFVLLSAGALFFRNLKLSKYFALYLILIVALSPNIDAQYLVIALVGWYLLSERLAVLYGVTVGALLFAYIFDWSEYFQTRFTPAVSEIYYFVYIFVGFGVGMYFLNRKFQIIMKKLTTGVFLVFGFITLLLFLLLSALHLKTLDNGPFQMTNRIAMENVFGKDILLKNDLSVTKFYNGTFMSAYDNLQALYIPYTIKEFEGRKDFTGSHISIELKSTDSRFYQKLEREINGTLTLDGIPFGFSPIEKSKGQQFALVVSSNLNPITQHGLELSPEKVLILRHLTPFDTLLKDKNALLTWINLKITSLFLEKQTYINMILMCFPLLLFASVYQMRSEKKKKI